MGLVTQQDPIGIAGGLNLYGYANGDPINFSDPFGLCPIPVSSCFGRGGVDLAAGFTPGVSTGVDVATALTGTSPITRDDVGGLGRGIAVAGVLSPISAGQIRAAGNFLEAGAKALAEKWGTRFGIRVRHALGRSDGASSATLREVDAAGAPVSVTHRVVGTNGNIVHQHQTHIGRYGTEREFPDEWVQFPRINER